MLPEPRLPPFLLGLRQPTNKPTTPLNFVDLEEEIYQMGGGRYYRINWDKVNKVIDQNTGIPERVSY